MSPAERKPVLDETGLALHPLRGIKQCLVAGLLVTIMLAILWTAWRSVAHRRLQSRLDAMRARHEPFEAGDFVTPAVPPNRNAALMWQAAFAAIPTGITSPSSSNLQFERSFPLPPEWLQLEDQAIVADAKALTLARHASDFPTANWSSSAPGGGRTVFGSARALTNILADATFHAHAHHDDAEALRGINDLLHEGDALEQMGSFVSHLVAVAMRSEAYLSLEAIAPDIAIEKTPGSGSGAASRVQAVALIADLSHEGTGRSAMQRAVYQNRFEECQYIKGCQSRSLLLRPLLDLSESRTLDVNAIDLAALQQPDGPSAVAMFSSANVPVATFATSTQQEWPRFSRIAEGRDFSMERYFFEAEWKMTTERRVAMTALAIKLYRMDHGGWPASLNDLVPDYLAAVPLNSYAAGHPPIGYVIRKHALPNGEDRPLLHYGFAADLETARVPSGPTYGTNSDIERGLNASGKPTNFEIIGQWRDLARWQKPHN